VAIFFCEKCGLAVRVDEAADRASDGVRAARVEPHEGITQGFEARIDGDRALAL
jgi:hypothetical protein